MKNSLLPITVHMVVKNEDQWIWFAIAAILPHVKHILITDTGSTDATVKIIESFASPKISLSQVVATRPAEITAIRNDQLGSTITPWVWMVDGDEIYSDELINEIEVAIRHPYSGIVVRRFDLLGDIYHRQLETVGSYHVFGVAGHLSTRLLNIGKLGSVEMRGDYPLEGYYTPSSLSIQALPKRDFYFTKHRYYHATYLRRSSAGANLWYVLHRKKFKIDQGVSITSVDLPSVFAAPRPSSIPDPYFSRSFWYELAACIITPIKNLKRKFL